MNFPLGRQNFYQEIHQPDEQIDLAKAALYIAQEEYPDLNTAKYLDAFDSMAKKVGERLSSERYPLRTIQTINCYLYDDLGFRGNTTDYYDPRNSFLNDVLDCRTGIPITLALVYLEIARRLDFQMVGIGMPGHFLIRPEFQEVGIFVDAFNRGEVLFEQDCQERLAQMYGREVQLQPAFIEPVSHRHFLARMLANLKVIYLNRQELPKALSTVERILLLFPDESTEVRDRGLIYYQMGRWTEAAQDLKTYLDNVPNTEDTNAIRRLLDQLERGRGGEGEPGERN